MLSVITYGRNDDYGYNLHKRAALSLNCIAQVLSDTTDEIVFVDYNTPDDFPTFPEAIRDTLTAKTKSLLRILRVRPEVHRRYRQRTHLPALEPIARNVGIRRSNRANRWILSTNTDMIFVPMGGRSLTEVARDQSPGYYHAPRFDIPESLWETFNRLDPDCVMQDAKLLGETANLNEIVFGAKHMLYDAPGDFQLAQRSDLFDIYGFCESMLRGWHVDANLAKRLYLRHGRVGDLATEIRAYHCEHTRQFSTMHYLSKQNDIEKFVDQIKDSKIPEQKDDWGLAEENIEEIHLCSCPSTTFLQGLGKTLLEEQVSTPDVLYSPESFNLVGYDSRHVLPYLADVLVNLPRHWSMAWIGGREETLNLISLMWRQLGFTGLIAVPQEGGGRLLNDGPIGIVPRPWQQLIREVDIFVFDFADIDCAEGISKLQGESRATVSALLKIFFSICHFEQRSAYCGDKQRQIILVNAINNDFEALSDKFLFAAKTAMTSRIRHGFVAPRLPTKCSWICQQLIGPAGERRGQNILIKPGHAGHVLYGPYRILEPGHYRIRLGIESETSGSSQSAEIPLVIEIVSEERFIMQRDLSCSALLEEGQHVLDFQVTDVAWRTEVRLWTSGELSGTVTTIDFETLDVEWGACA